MTGEWRYGGRKKRLEIINFCIIHLGLFPLLRENKVLYHFKNKYRMFYKVNKPRPHFE